MGLKNNIRHLCGFADLFIDNKKEALLWASWFCLLLCTFFADINFTVLRVYFNWFSFDNLVALPAP
jgi:hypothetical protein